jgi:hypothetical protein
MLNFKSFLFLMFHDVATPGGKFSVFYPAEEPFLSCVRCTSFAVVCAFSYVLGLLPSCLHSMLTWSAYSQTLHIYNPKYSPPPMSHVHSTARSSTLTIKFAFHSTYCHLYTSWNSQSCVHYTERSVTCALLNIYGYFVSVKEWVLPLFSVKEWILSLCFYQGSSSGTFFLLTSEFWHFLSVREWVLPLCFCQILNCATLFLSEMSSATLFLSRNEFRHVVSVRSEFQHFVSFTWWLLALVSVRWWLPALCVCHVVISGTLFMSRGEFRPFLSVA